MTQPAKKTSQVTDWHNADIKAALDKAGWSFNQLGKAHGYNCKSALARALHGPYPRAERLIAAAIGVKPEVIWPTRYDRDGKPNRPPGRKPKRPADVRLSKPTTAHGSRNLQQRLAG